MELDRLSLCLDEISDGVAVFDAARHLVVANAAFRRIDPGLDARLVPGLSHAELLRSAGPVLYGPDAPAWVTTAAAQPEDNGSPGDRTFDYRLPDGRCFRATDRATADGGLLCIRTDITELRRREQALGDSERQYRQLVDLSPDGIAVHGETGQGHFLNAAGRRILGVAEDVPADSLNLLDFTRPDERGEMGAIMAAVARGDGLNQIRFRARRGDGTPIVLELSAVPFARGGERLVLTIFRDITEQKRAQQELADKTRMLEAMLDSIDLGIVIADADGCQMVANAKVQELLDLPDHLMPQGTGYVESLSWLHAQGEFPGRPLAEILGAYRAMLIHRVPYRSLRQRPNGRWLQTNYTQMQGDGVVGVLEDITDRKRAQEEIEEKTRILEAMMASIGTGISIYDRQGRVLLANAKMAELLDLPPGLLEPGHRLERVVEWQWSQGEFPDRTLAEVLADLRPIRDGRTYQAERRRPNGRWIQVRYFPMAGGGSVGLVADVTEQKMLQAQLLQSQKMEALGQLAGGVAHDFNNILQVIGGYATLAQSLAGEGPGAAALAGYLDKIGQGVQRASALTRELLTFSRRKAAETSLVDLADLVRRQEFLLGPLLGETVPLSLDLPSTPVWVSVDPDMVAQALVNLAINARDAMPGGGPLTVTLEERPADAPRPPDLGQGACAVLSVADRGIGMDDEVRARIFEPFYTTKPPGQGTGLGLSMVYGTVRQAGGAIEVDSVPGQGTCFRLWFPTAAPPRRASAAGLPPCAATAACRGTILLVEDEPDLLELARVTLAADGYAVRTASNGVEALELFAAGGIDLVLTDLVMPDLGGIRLAQRVAELDPAVKVLFMTGYPSRGEYATGDLPPDATVLFKPIALDALRAAVAKALDA